MSESAHFSYTGCTDAKQEKYTKVYIKMYLIYVHILREEFTLQTTLIVLSENLKHPYSVCTWENSQKEDKAWVQI